MLLRNRSRAVTKPNLMGDHTPQQHQHSNQNFTRTIPSLFDSPKFRDFITTKCLSRGTDTLRSPTSILDTRALSPFANPLLCENITDSKNKIDSEKGIGLALVSSLKDEPIDENSLKPNKRNVVFGTNLRVKVSSLQNFSCESETCDVSLNEMEEYTRVISHGPNPRTTHIFHNCVVESYCYSNSVNFLSFCYTCKKHLEHTKDIFIYRGEKAFCSEECRHQEMVLDGAESSDFDIY